VRNRELPASAGPEASRLLARDDSGKFFLGILEYFAQP
jgi:hypothetical protein